MLNLAHFLDATAREHPDTTAAILDDFRLSYAELASAARRVANVLRAKGIGHGDKVAMMVPNTPHFPIIYYGILQTGAAVVPVNVLLRRHEIQHYLNDSGAVAFIAFRLFEEDARLAFLDTPTCHHLIITGAPDDVEPPSLGENLAHLTAAVDDFFDTYQTMPDDTAVILYTSGTTGVSKGAELTHFNMFFNAHYTWNSILDLHAGDTVLVALPLFHSFGQTCLMNASIIGGATMSMLSRFETGKAMEVIQRDRVAAIALVPTMYFFLLNQEGWEAYDLSSIRVAVSGGAALPEEIHRRFKERYGITILEGYGLSETSPVASFTQPGEKVRVGSIGKPIWGVEMRVMFDDGTFADPGEVGEIVIRGHNIMKGYINRPEATREAIDGGWFHTGDLGRTDEDGFFYIVDRKKDLIIRGGMNIYPREIEEVLYQHPKVLEAAVVGIPDSIRGEEVKAYISPRHGEEITAEEIRTYIEGRLAKYKWPKEIEVLSELPKGPTGKLLKRELRPKAPKTT